jgi:lon-related putative ATP-dependent protease
MTAEARAVSPGELWCPCDLEEFGFETTAELPDVVQIIGQDRAVRAIDVGMGMPSSGFNVYALGRTGTGRTTTVRTFLDKIAVDEPVPDDWVYVNNFRDRYKPRAIEFRPGRAQGFQRDMDELVEDLQREIPRAFESKEYEQQRERIVREMQEERNNEFMHLEARVNEQGFTLLKTAMGLGMAPVLNGQVLTPERYKQLDEKTQEELEQRQKALQSEMAETVRRVRDLEKEAKQELQALDGQIADFAVGHLIEELRQAYADCVEVIEYLDEVQADIVENVGGFRDEEEPSERTTAAMIAVQKEALLNRYRVNVIVDRTGETGAPVVFEPNPTYTNLVGRIEHKAEFGALVTDFTMIKAGALHRANGGYLVVEALSVLTSPLAWDALKRAVKNRQIRTEELGEQLRLISTITLEPEPIPLDVKVVLIGDPMTYYVLYGHDEDFRKFFKVKADFGPTMPRTPEACQQYAQFVASRCHREGLLPFRREAVGRVVEFGTRLAEDQGKLATRFGEIADLVRESSFWAGRAGRDAVTAEDVQRAIDEKVYRSNRLEEWMQETITDGTVQVDVEGEVVGQVNGLSVLSMADYSFGKPTRITVQTYTGRKGVVSLDREAKLSGRIYDKGVLTLSGYLGATYARQESLSLAASISFEQSYEPIDGDSASSTELYALISSLARVPIRQGTAVTGSVDQQGRVQPVGGVNEKIESFFDICKAHGLTGEQGVMIPARNVKNLMLRADVREAVADGQFHIWAVETIDQGLELLTGQPAGERLEDATFPEGTIHRRVADRLAEIVETLQAKKEEARERSSDETAKEDQDDDTPEPEVPGEPPVGDNGQNSPLGT